MRGGVNEKMLPLPYGIYSGTRYCLFFFNLCFFCMQEVNSRDISGPVLP